MGKMYDLTDHPKINLGNGWRESGSLFRHDNNGTSLAVRMRDRKQAALDLELLVHLQTASVELDTGHARIVQHDLHVVPPEHLIRSRLGKRLVTGFLCGNARGNVTRRCCLRQAVFTFTREQQPIERTIAKLRDEPFDAVDVNQVDSYANRAHTQNTICQILVSQPGAGTNPPRTSPNQAAAGTTTTATVSTGHTGFRHADI